MKNKLVVLALSLSLLLPAQLTLSQLAYSVEPAPVATPAPGGLTTATGPAPAVPAVEKKESSTNPWLIGAGVAAGIGIGAVAGTAYMAYRIANVIWNGIWQAPILIPKNIVKNLSHPELIGHEGPSASINTRSLKPELAADAPMLESKPTVAEVKAAI
jgi:hypothetical protein